MKHTMLICAPFSSRSGYGNHARDLFYSLDKMNKFEIKCLDVNWGECPRNALVEDTEFNKNLISTFIHQQDIGKWLNNRQLDFYMDIRIPNEFQQYAKFNIGVTAGIETNAVSQKWIESCNKMDLIIVPSEHSKAGFVNSIYDKIQQMPDGKQQKVGELKLEKPMEVLFEGADDKIWKPLKATEIEENFYNEINDLVKENFAFLFVGQWCKGGYGEDRKDIGRMLKLFYESFANMNNAPAMILKTSGAGFSIMDREDCIKKIKLIQSQFPSDLKLPNVYLVHGDLKEEELNYLYNHPKVKSLVNLTHGEGFGRPMLEATMTGLPVMASGWSGQMDFLDRNQSVLIGGELKQVPKSVVWKDIIIPQSQWYNVDEASVVKAFKHIHKNNLQVKKNAKQLMETNRKKFTLDKMTEKFSEIMTKITDSIPQQVPMSLPKLKKKSDEKPVETPKVTLPKLKKLSQEAANG